MSELKIYGHPRSRAFRPVWMAEELGIEFDNIALRARLGESRTPEYLAINPNGHIPAICDGDFIMWESLAINIYLAKKFPGPLSPATLEEEGLTLQWSMWAISKLEPAHSTLIQVRDVVGNHPPDAIDKVGKTIREPLGILNNVLSERKYLLGERFTVADLNLSSVLSVLPQVEFNFGSFSNLEKWLNDCLERPAAVATLALRHQN
jgi:glutathione S-transferase